jgi:hypothetical protein
VVTVRDRPDWRPVASGGVAMVRGAGGHHHTLAADPDTCRWTTQVRDPLRLAVAVFENTAPVYLVHPEHGASGVAPGCWLLRRQHERGAGFSGGNLLVAD